MEETEQKSPLWQRKKEMRPNEIIRAARKLFVSRGFAATKMASVAHEAGVQPGTLYVYFKNKKALFKAVIESSIGPVLKIGDELVDSFSGTPEEMVRSLVHEWWRLIESEECRGIVKLIVAESQNFPDIAKFYAENCMEPAKKICYRILEYALSKNQVQLLNLELASRVIYQHLHQLAIYEHSFAEYDSNPIPVPTLLNATADFIIRSVLRSEK